MKLSVLMPVFDESRTLREAAKRILDLKLPAELELVIVDDGSTDGTADICRDLASDPRVVTAAHERNAGKGAALRTAGRLASGDYAVVCDGDLEYDAADLARLLAVVTDGIEVIYGTRSFSGHTAYSFWYVMGNRLVTFATNLLYDCWITDLMTCSKLLPLPLLRDLDLRCDGFDVEAEITAKLLIRGIRPYEVPVSYRARSRGEGKKLVWRDGVKVLWVLTRVRTTAARRRRTSASDRSAW
ncbi:MAG TPA: glycosyltransferase family 2 protein [Mycobacteriales bacterium]|nr:glycosyltransferase family 2 protein [Mycobacteriales bacterium]